MTARHPILFAAILMAGSTAAANAAEDASAEVARPNPTSKALDTTHRHLGLFIRPDVGIGYFRASASPGGVDTSLSGLAGTFGIAVGGAISENSILAFHVWDMVVTNPTYTTGGTTYENVDATVTIMAFGPQYTAYTADNVYFSVTPALTRGSISTQGSTSDSDWGFGLRGAIGKEWWVADRWALGIAGHVSLSTNRAPGTDGGTWTSWGASVAFSATYN